jgi:hypothetical protein
MIMTERRLFDVDDFFQRLRKLEARLRNGEISEIDLNLLVASLPRVEAKEVVHAQWQKQWCDSSMIGHMYEECPICGCMILDTEKFWDCKFCPNCGTEMIGD